MTVTLVLFDKTPLAPIYSKTIAITEEVQSIDLGWSYEGSAFGQSSELYYGYFTQWLSVTPFKRDYENSTIQNVIKHLCIDSVMDEGSTGNIVLKNVVTTTEDWGLNPNITTLYDFTDFILQNEKLFQQAILYQCRILFLQNYLASLRTTINERASKDVINQVTIELEGLTQDTGINKPGLQQKLFSEVKRLKKEIEKMQEGFFGTTVEYITRTG